MAEKVYFLRMITLPYQTKEWQLWIIVLFLIRHCHTMMILWCIELDNFLMRLEVWPILIPHILCLITHCLLGISDAWETLMCQLIQRQLQMTHLYHWQSRVDLYQVIFYWLRKLWIMLINASLKLKQMKNTQQELDSVYESICELVKYEIEKN